MSKKSTGNIETCRISAQQFLDIAEKLATDDGIIKEYVRPFYVNAGLSCELFLKAIQMEENSDNSFEKGHKLDVLFSRISENARCEIQNTYDTYYESFPMKKELTGYLSSCPEPFIDFRYTFEGSAEGNSRALLFFAKSLQLYTEKLFIK